MLAVVISILIIILNVYLRCHLLHEAFCSSLMERVVTLKAYHVECLLTTQAFHRVALC